MQVSRGSVGATVRGSSVITSLTGGTGGVPAADDHAAHQVALGKDASELAILQNRHGADVVLHHHAGDFEHGLVGFGGDGDLILEQIADQHLHLPWIFAGERRAQRAASIQY
jgi:hypothetical protein